MLNGKTFENINEVFRNSELEQITNEKYITINKSNKLIYEAGDNEVKIRVDIKNVDKLTIKVFEINTENYYLKN